MALKQSLALCHDTEVGGIGLSASEIAAAAARAKPGLEWLREAARSGALPLLGLPVRTDDLDDIAEAAAWLAKDSADVLVLGTGGSSLGGQTLAQLGGWRVPVLGDLTGGPRMHFLDNLDPLSLDGALERLDLAATRTLVVSKSGGTGETLMQAMALVAAYEDAGLGQELGRHVLGLSEPAGPRGPNKLRRLLEPLGVRFLDHDPGIGGRFAALTNVGLIPAALTGRDTAALRRGAASALAPVLDGAAPEDCPPALGAAVSVAFAEDRDLTIDVMLAYADRLERFTRWWVQLWSESLGKDGHGMTAVPALGPVDQHSALQLFLDGPADKVFTLIAPECRGLGPRIDAALAAEAGQPEFAGRTVGDFVASQSRATADTLARNGRPVRLFHLDSLDEEHLGALMMHFMLETILAARLMGVDAFDQPAVEEGKVLARGYLAEL